MDHPSHVTPPDWTWAELRDHLMMDHDLTVADDTDVHRRRRSAQVMHAGAHLLDVPPPIPRDGWE